MRTFALHTLVASMVLLQGRSATADPTALNGAPPHAEEAIARSATAPVVFRDQRLFEIRSMLGKRSPAERAAAVAQRVHTLAEGSATVVDDIRVEERAESSDLYAGDQLVMSVTSADAAPTGRTRQQLGADDALRLRDALEREFHGRSTRGLLQGLGALTLATLVFAFALVGLGRGFRRAVTRLRTFSKRRIPAFRFRGVEALSSDRIADLMESAARLVRVVVVIVTGYIYLNLALGFFPWTRGLSQQLYDYVSSTVGHTLLALLHYLPNLLYIAVIVVVTRYIVKAARAISNGVESGAIPIKGFLPDWARPTYRIVAFLIYAFALIIIFPYLPGSGSPAFQGVSVFVGLLLSLGSASAIGNVVAGIVLTYMHPFRVGDWVQLSDTVGDVVSKQMLVVRIRTIKNVVVTIPNSVVLSGHIINFSSVAKDDGLILHAEVTIGYDAPWRTVHELLVAAATKTEGILTAPAPFVLQTDLDDFYVHYEINAFTDKPRDMTRIYSELNSRIQDAFNEAGVEIMSPHFTAARDGNAIAIPKKYVPATYKSPAFRIIQALTGADESGAIATKK